MIGFRNQAQSTMGSSCPFECLNAEPDLLPSSFPPLWEFRGLDPNSGTRYSMFRLVYPGTEALPRPCAYHSHLNLTPSAAGTEYPQTAENFPYEAGLTLVNDK